MATEDRSGPSSSTDAEAWLDGLAGRGGAHGAAQDGARLRDALKPDAGSAPSLQLPPWQDVVVAARQPVQPLPTAAQHEAANQARWRQRAGGAMVVFAFAVAAGLWAAAQRPGDDAGTVRGAPSPGGATWRTQDPPQAARDLAARLQALGARVTVTHRVAGVLLTVECDPAVCPAANDALSPLDVAVDANGKLKLQVLPLR